MLTQIAPPTAQALAPVASVAPVAATTVWYYVSVVTTDDLYGFYLELEETYLGLGHKEQIWATAQTRYPGCAVMDYRICRPQA